MQTPSLLNSYLYFLAENRLIKILKARVEEQLKQASLNKAKKPTQAQQIFDNCKTSLTESTQALIQLQQKNHITIQQLLTAQQLSKKSAGACNVPMTSVSALHRSMLTKEVQKRKK